MLPQKSLSFPFSPILLTFVNTWYFCTKSGCLLGVARPSKMPTAAQHPAPSAGQLSSLLPKTYLTSIRLTINKPGELQVDELFFFFFFLQRTRSLCRSVRVEEGNLMCLLLSHHLTDPHPWLPVLPPPSSPGQQMSLVSPVLWTPHTLPFANYCL